VPLIPLAPPTQVRPRAFGLPERQVTVHIDDALIYLTDPTVAARIRQDWDAAKYLAAQRLPESSKPRIAAMLGLAVGSPLRSGFGDAVSAIGGRRGRTGRGRMLAWWVGRASSPDDVVHEGYSAVCVEMQGDDS